MNKFGEESLLSRFPEPLKSSDSINSMATAAAKELDTLFESGNYVELYARIDELSEPLLDILANDFKIDWWNNDFDIAAKRDTLKKAWEIHRIIGTPAAVNLALSAIYENAEIEEWYNYGGEPFHYGVKIETGEKYPDYDMLIQLLSRIRFYTNLRSKLDHISFDSQKNEKSFFGIASHYSDHFTLTVSTSEFNIYLTDENGNQLTDENGNKLIL